MLFEEAVSEYMTDKSRRLRATTLAGYESAIRCHLMPMWAGYVSVHADGTVCCMSEAPGDFSGQVCFVA